MMAAFGRTTNAFIADANAKNALLLPDSGVDVRQAGHLAEVAVTAGKDYPELPWFQLCKALAAYRQGEPSTAATFARKTLTAAGWELERDATAYAILAMAEHQLKQPQQARQALAEAVSIIQTRLPQTDKGELDQNWVDGVIARILLREAREFVEAPPGTHR